MDINKEAITSLTSSLESCSHRTMLGVEYWSARDIQKLLGYTDWRNFLSVVGKARTACKVSGHVINDHFFNCDRYIRLSLTNLKMTDDVMLTRYACYLVAQNGDLRKEQIAFAQTYFAMQARKAELIEQRLLERERLHARKKLTQTEKKLSSVIYEQIGDNQDFGLIRSKGDQALFGKTTKQMKSAWKVHGNRPLADFAPTVILKAKDFATEITVHNARENKMDNARKISEEHTTNNQEVRKILISRGIRPETLPANEDLKKIEKRLASEDKQAVEAIDAFSRANNKPDKQ